MRKVLPLGLIIVSLLFFTFLIAHAQDAAAPAASDLDFVTQVVAVVKGFGGMGAMLKLSAAITLLIASMKVSFLNPLWSKLGSAQIWVAPILGLIGSLIAMISGGAPVSGASVFAFVFTGLGSVYMHEILDLVKQIPGLGSIYISLINLVQAIPGFGSGLSEPKK